MTRLIVFLSVLTTFVLALVMFSYKSLPVSNEKFDLLKTEERHKEHEHLVQTLLAPKEKVADVEVVVKKSERPFSNGVYKVEFPSAVE